MGRTVKCSYCEGKVEKELAYIYKKRNYHTECFEIWHQEKQDYEDLLNYVCKLYRLDYPTGLILKQIKTYKEENTYKYKGMELALRYFYETLDNKPRSGDGVGIIPYVYEDAKEHYIKQMKIAQSLTTSTEQDVQVVHINPSLQKRKVKKIDIASI